MKQLWIGLGNNGVKYKNNRHNIGFMSVDNIKESLGFNDWKTVLGSKISNGVIEGQSITLMKPKGYMNLSGDEVIKIVNYFKFSPEDLVIFHDELDLKPFEVRFKESGGTAGHNGLKSLKTHFPDFRRVRIGIGRPEDKEKVIDYVLSDFYENEREGLEKVLKKIVLASSHLAKNDIEKFVKEIGNE